MRKPKPVTKQPEFTHLNAEGAVHMVDVSAKSPTVREAVASARVLLGAELIMRIFDADMPKGDVLATVRVAAIQASKKCSELIPLCHQINLDKVEVEIARDGEDSLTIRVTCCTSSRTGVEMEALTGASVGALTLYDMCKSIDKNIQIERIQLEEKRGGKSGDWRRG